ncbi:bifunctional metallophosphatase/5'-nucleotidase [Intrasporangium sp.]|uniref:bifunctional metallophosphatase/5'-nucleotidase n=1 Tax=Intrasporangium sp. TaxID=1925024 RepID=UPI00293B4FF7|nr:5'-nucleotidase C-terminal domain-containing protein [Intrasporangium sp.]MDV3221945.1 bifunctional metallophosphatase/5'-nucleotidase [Intrasporangium sp.]
MTRPSPAAGAVMPGAAAVASASGASTSAPARSRAVRNGRARHLTILETADIHGQLDTHDEFFWEDGGPTFRRTGGLARIQTLVDQVRRENPAGTILVDGGDCFQGSGWVALSKGKAMGPVMRHLRYDAILPGNWEVVYGKQQLLEVMSDYDAPIVCSNMHHDRGDAPGDHLFEPVHVQDVNGIRVGFLGYNDPMVPIRQDPTYSEGITFTRPEESAARWVRHLREDRACDVVLAITHLGLARQVDLAGRDFMQGVDYILGADTHERIRTPIEGTYAAVTEPGAFGSFVGRLDLVIEKGRIREATYDLMEVAEAEYDEDRSMRAVVDEVQAPYRTELSQVLGTTATPLLRYYVLETPMDNLVTDALFEATAEELGRTGRTLDVALSNGFRFCPPLLPGPGGTADVTREYLWSMLPVNAGARVATVPGALVREWMEKELDNVFADDPLQRFGGWLVRMKGMEVDVTAGAPMGRRVNSLTIGGDEVDPDRDYTFVACERTGDPPDVLCRIKGVRDREDLSFTLHDAVERYLGVHSPVRPQQEGRVTATDLPATALGRLPGTDYEFR